MATPHYFGIDRGALDEHAVVEGTSTTGKAIELTVDLDSGVVKGELYVLIDCIRNFLSRSLYPKDN